MSISPPITDIQLFQNLTLKIHGHLHACGQGYLDQGHDQGQTWWLHLRPGVQSLRSFFILWQSDHFVIRYSEFHILPWKFQVRVKPDGHIWGLEFNRYVCFLFRDNFWMRYSKFHIWPLKFKVKVTTKIDQNVNRQCVGQGHQSCQKLTKSKKLYESYRVN